MLLYAAALAAMFVCQNGLTRVIQAPPRRPRAPRKAASRGPPKTDAPNPLGSITITTPARPTRCRPFGHPLEPRNPLLWITTHYL